MASNTNTALGYCALTNPTGLNNTAIGYYSSDLTTTGFQNTAVGSNSLLLNTEGNNNTCVGSGSMVSTTSGNCNTAIGSSSLASHINGDGNVCVGASALYSCNADNNTALGTNALRTFTAGEENVAVGHNAGIEQLFYNNVTLLGANTDTLNNDTFYSTAVGCGAVVEGNNVIQLGGLNPMIDASGNQVVDSSGIAQTTYPEVVAYGGVTTSQVSLDYYPSVNAPVNLQNMIGWMQPSTPLTFSDPTQIIAQGSTYNNYATSIPVPQGTYIVNIGFTFNYVTNSDATINIQNSFGTTIVCFPQTVASNYITGYTTTYYTYYSSSPAPPTPVMIFDTATISGVIQSQSVAGTAVGLSFLTFQSSVIPVESLYFYYTLTRIA